MICTVFYSQSFCNIPIRIKDFIRSVSSYVEKEDKREVIDIVALNEEIEALSREVTSKSLKLNEIIKEL